MKYLMLKDKKVLFFLITSILFALLFSITSPFHLRGQDVDFNAFMTVGKVLKGGGVLYKDIYDQKGPIYLFLFYIQALISVKKYYFLFIIVIMLNYFMMHYAYKLAHFITKSESKSYIVAAMGTFVFYISSHGMFIPEIFMIVIVMYILSNSYINIIENKKIFTNLQYFINALIFVFLIFTKITLAFTYVGLYIFILFILIREKNLKEFKNFVAFTALGIIAVVIPVLIYFKFHNFLSSMFYYYITVNYKYYGYINPNELLSDDYVRGFKFPLIIVQNFFKSVSEFFDIYNLGIKVILLKLPIIFAFIFLIIKRNLFNVKTFSLIFVIFFSTIYGVFFGKYAYFYYLSPFYPFVLILLIFVLNKLRIKKLSLSWLAVLTICLTISVQPIMMRQSILLRDNRQTEFETFSNYINEKNSNAKVLQLALDSGIYSEIKSNPISKFAYVPNGFSKFEELWKSEVDSLSNKKPDYVIFTKKALLESDTSKKYIKTITKLLKNNYVKVKFANKNTRFTLLEKLKKD